MNNFICYSYWFIRYLIFQMQTRCWTMATGFSWTWKQPSVSLGASNLDGSRDSFPPLPKRQDFFN